MASWNVILSFLFETLLISFIARAIGCIVVLPLRRDPTDHELLGLLQDCLRVQNHFQC